MDSGQVLHRGKLNFQLQVHGAAFYLKNNYCFFKRADSKVSQPQTSKQKVAVWKIVSETEQILGAIRGRCARGKGETLPWEPAVKSPRPASADTAGCVRGCKNRFSTGGGWGKWGFKGTDAHEIKIRRASQEAQRVKNPPAMRETRV